MKIVNSERGESESAWTMAEASCSATNASRVQTSWQAKGKVASGAQRSVRLGIVRQSAHSE